MSTVSIVGKDRRSEITDNGNGTWTVAVIDNSNDQPISSQSFNSSEAAYQYATNSAK